MTVPAAALTGVLVPPAPSAAVLALARVLVPRHGYDFVCRGRPLALRMRRVMRLIGVRVVYRVRGEIVYTEWRAQAEKRCNQCDHRQARRAGETLSPRSKPMPERAHRLLHSDGI
jgi:hypothetical protein